MVYGLWFMVYGLWFMGFGFKVQFLRFRKWVLCLVLRVWTSDLGFRV